MISKRREDFALDGLNDCLDLAEIVRDMSPSGYLRLKTNALVKHDRFANRENLKGLRHAQGDKT